MGVPSTAARDARLDQLATAVADWSKVRTQYINDEVAFLRRVLKGRAGAQNVSVGITSQATSLSVDAIQQFLTGQ